MTGDIMLLENFINMFISRKERHKLMSNQNYIQHWKILQENQK